MVRIKVYKMTKKDIKNITRALTGPLLPSSGQKAKAFQNILE